MADQQIPSTPAVPQTSAAISPANAIPAAANLPFVGGQVGSSIHASLYVGGLAPETTEAQIYELFSQPATIMSAKICRHSETGQSFGYAYVNYHAVADAQTAMDTLNFHKINGRRCRIMWANKNNLKHPELNLYVKNIDKNMSDKDLFETFSLFGQVTSCKIARDSRGGSLGYGFVQYASDASVKEAIDKINGQQVGNSILFCCRHKKKTERESLREKLFTNVYVKGFPSSVTEKQLKEFFEEHAGPITSIIVKSREKYNNMSFGMINFASMLDAKKAVDDLHCSIMAEGFKLVVKGKDRPLSLRVYVETGASQDCEGVKVPEVPATEQQGEFSLYVQRFESKAERLEKLAEQKASETRTNQSVLLYTRGFPLEFSDADLREVFAELGVVTSCSINRDSSGSSIGTGYVAYVDQQDAHKAIQTLHEKEVIPGSGQKLFVSYLERRENRTERIKAQLSQQLPQMSFGAAEEPMSTTPLGRPVPQVRTSPAVRVEAAKKPLVATRVQRPNRPVQSASRPLPRTTGQFDDLAESQMKKMSFKDQKQLIGDRLYHLISAKNPELAGKITGMMLEMDNTELLKMIKDPHSLHNKYEEAVAVLNAALKEPTAPKHRPTTKAAATDGNATTSQ